MNTDKKYVMVTCISSFRQRYCVPADAFDDWENLNNQQLVDYAKDSVTCEEVKEFSQHWIGEQILDTFIVDEPRMLLTFNRDNDYLADWSDEKKVEWVNDWKENNDT
jgi:hypothetical protein